MRLCICEICMFAHVGPNDSIKQIEHTIASFVVLDALRMRLTISCCFGIRYSRFHSNTTATRQSTTWFNHFRDRRERVSELRCSHAIRTRISLKYVERTQSAVHGQLTSCICVCVSTDLVSAVFIAFMSPNSIHLLLWERTLASISLPSFFSRRLSLVLFICTIIIHILCSCTFLLSPILWSFSMLIFFPFPIFSQKTFSHCDNTVFGLTFKCPT